VHLPERCRGREVAVKVLRPGVESLVSLDIDISFRILWVLNVLFPNHHVRAATGAFREFERRIHGELDLRQEAEYTERFRKQFADDPRVGAPEVVPEFTRRRVMVTEFVHGTKIDRLDEHFARGQISFAQVMDTLTEIYVRMMLIDGVLHADPHPGNILVREDGMLVFLDFGMIVTIERSTRDKLFRLSLAAARDDLDAMINEMYGLGMIDPEVSRTEIRDSAVRIMGILAQARELTPRKIQEMVQEILDTFYTFPLILPEELVYFFRATALLEGIGFRYDPHFNGVETVKPVVSRMRGELLRAMVPEPRASVGDAVGQAEQVLRALYDLVRRADREELRVRAHPRDVLQQERFIGLMVRRLLLGLFASVMAIVSTLVFVATRSWIVLAAGNAIALFMFLLILVIPKHLLENPLRQAKSVRRGTRPGR
jgi:predicted unusual protein kinase regulating ubiquinone biosynthesis (AarF/ABC1/UbiB family)